MSFEKVILDAAADNGTTLVFPSEISAYFWRRKVMAAGVASTVPADRFLSWDRFKESITATEYSLRPANRALRLLFASYFLQKVASGEVSVESFIPGNFRWNASSFTSWLSRMLPGCKAVSEAAEAAGGDALGPVYRDLIFIEDSYRTFLEEKGFFEPSWHTAQPVIGESRYLVCFPEIIEDFGDYAPFFTGRNVDVLPVKATTTGAEIHRFPTTMEEMDWVLAGVAEYLEDGMSPGDIVITLPDGDEWRYLEDEARLYGVPLDIRIGKTLTDYRGGAFFRLLGEVGTGGLELETLERLFLDHAFPWKDRETGTNIVRFGREHGLLKNYGNVNLWKRKLKAFGLSRLRDYLDSIVSGVKGLSDASSFYELRIAMYAFIDRFLNPENWSSIDGQVVRYALDSLGELVKTEEYLSEPSKSRPFQLWLTYLSGSVYVPRGTGLGVRVFPYGVTAGIMPSVHFIIGIDQARIRRTVSLPTFLREDQRLACGITDMDITDDFLSLYMASGEKVFISYSGQGFEGPHLAPSLLQGKTEGDGEAWSAGPCVGEESYWNGTSPLPERLPQCMKLGFSRISSTAFHSVPSSFDFSGNTELAHTLAGKNTDDEGRIVISPTGLDSFNLCRFQYLLTHLLDVDDNIPAPLFPDPLERGIFLHEVFKQFMELVRRDEAGIQPGAHEKYIPVFRSVIERTARAWEKAGRAFIEPVWQTQLEWASERGEEFIRAEAKNFPGYRPVWLEKSLSYPLEGAPVLLKGFIDRLSVSGDKTLLVDYKTRVYFRKSEFSGEQAPKSYQLPMYAHLVQHEGFDVTCAAYYDISEAGYARIFDRGDGGWMTDEAFFRWGDSIPELAENMAGLLQRGDFSFTGDQTCDGCDYRMVCRRKFYVRFQPVKGDGS